MLYNIEINTETDIAREDYKPTIIYNSNDHTASLLDRIMEKTPHYKIRHVDSSIAKLQRTFAFDGKSLRDALLEICKEVNALLIIHSGTDANGKIERAYSIYDLEDHCPNCGYRGKRENGKCPECGKSEWSSGYGEDTGIFISSENLADDITYETTKDSVKNCFRLVAGDSLMTSAVAAANPNGSGYLWYISDKVRGDMSPELRNRLKEYDDLYKAVQDSVLDAYYDSIDFELYLEHELLPDVDPPITSAANELKKLIAKISPVSVRTISSLSSTTATSYVAQAARAIVDPRYYVSTKDETLNGDTWSGSFIITRYSDDSDTATSANISVSLDENYENFIRIQIERILNSSEFEDLDIVSLFNKSGSAFVTAIKQYSLSMLKSFYDACQACLNVLVEHNSANESIWAQIYHDLYEPYYEKLGYLQYEISLRESEIETVQIAQAEVSDVITTTQNELDFEKFIGEELWLEFSAYRREDTYQNDNYISDGLDNADLVKNAREFLKIAQEDIEKSATLQHSITANLDNLLVMKEFKGITDNFELGNWLRIKVDDNIYVLRLIDYEIDFDNLETLSVEYSDVIESPSSANDIKSILNSASSMASSYSSVSRQAKHGEKSNRQLDSWVTDGLQATKIKFLSDADNQNITWDKNGMLFRKWDEITESYEDTQLRIINSTIAVTDDNWKTVKTAIGGFNYKDPVTGEIKYGYGINAELLIGRLILGEELGLYNESNSLTFDRNGLSITNGNNTFTVSPNGSDLLVVECGQGNKVMWIDENGGLHLKPTYFELTTGETLEGLSSRITQTAEAITAEVTRATEAEGTLSGKIELTAENLTTEFNKTIKTETDRATQVEKELSSSITQTAESLTSTFTAKITEESERAQGVEATLTSTITQTAEAITAEVTRATEAEGNLSSRVTQTANSISSEITRAKEAESTLSSQITQTVNAIRLSVSSKTSGDETETTLSITSGSASLNSVKITGTTAEQAAKISADAVKGITLTVSNSTTGASSTLTLKSGSTTLSSGKIEFTGLVTFSNLKDGKTEISGNNITTGTIAADRIDVSSLFITRVYVSTGSAASQKQVVIFANGSLNSSNLFLGGTDQSGYAGSSVVNTISLIAKSDVAIGRTYSSYSAPQKAEMLIFDTVNRKVYPYNSNYSWTLGTSNNPFSEIHTTVAYLGNNTTSAKVGFFGTTPHTKTTVSTISGTSSATTSTIATKVNDLINALKNYGLV